MWSLGVLTYVMLTTCSPFAGDDQNETFSNITQVKLDFPDELFGHIHISAQDFISKLLVKKPRDRLTAKECLDHPWLADLTKKLAISVPTPDHSFELAQEMVTPSNWHLSVDRQTSLSSMDDSVNSTKSPFKEDISPAVHRLNEEKDSISKTLSHIDIDHGSRNSTVSPSSSSSSHYQTCVNSVDSITELVTLEGEDSFTSLPSLKDEHESMLSSENSPCPKSTKTTMPSLITEENHNLSKFAAEFVEDALSISESTLMNKTNVLPSATTVTQSLETSTALPLGASKDSTENGKPTFQSAASPCVTPVLSHDSNKQHNSNALKRMSMEIPPKKAKCIVDSSNDLPSNPPCDQQCQIPDTNGQAVNNNNIEDFRNAV